ncbi:MAG: CHAT domain-containing protein [Myxococcales bacterium]|nr:CHAT domain-containing protein [Myxococcales bacterium]
MTDGTAEVLEISLEFARAEHTGDAHSFRFSPQAYIARTPRGGFERAELAWDADLLADLQAVRSPGRDPAVQQRVGEVLRRFLAPTGWEQHEAAIAEAVRQRRSVRVSLRSAAAELYALPWELLALRASGQALGGLPGVLVRYEWPETVTAAAEPASGRVLLAWSAAGGAVPAGEHVAAVRRAAGERGGFDAARDVLARASSGRLAAALAEAEAGGRPVTLLHVLCHGAAQGQVFGLALDGEEDDRAPVVIDPGRLAQILAPHAATLRLVVLAACDSGNAGAPGNRIGSVAQMLHRAGLAAVVASRYPLSVSGSVRLTAALYAGLLAGGSLEAAFLAARAALAGDAASLDWASVQLYARAADGVSTRLFAAPAPAPAPEPEPRRRRWLGPGLAAAAALAVAVWSLGHVFEDGEERAPTTAATELQGAAKAAEAKVADTKVAGEAKAADTGEANAATGEANAATGEAKAAATAGPEAPVEAAKPTGGPVKKPVKHHAHPTGAPTRACAPALQGYIRGLVPGTGTQVTPLVIVAGEAGGLSLASGDAAARAGLGRARAERVVAAAGGELPCRYDYEWSR